MKESLLTVLRDRTTTHGAFRKASNTLAEILAAECASMVAQEPVSVQTPIGPATGRRLEAQVVLIPILRAGLALLPAFLRLFEEAQTGFFGIRRDEETSLPCQYYENIPPLSAKHFLFVLDPMIATGGSSVLAIRQLIHKGASPARITLVGVIAATEGVHAVRSRFPEVRVHVVAEDKELNARKFIVPGLGDFGDRYFGTH
jgi:uracil phosphoribosyltransferase